MTLMEQFYQLNEQLMAKINDLAKLFYQLNEHLIAQIWGE